MTHDVKPRLAIPTELMTAPFRRADAHELGLNRRMLQGSRFWRVLADVYAVREVADLPLTRALAYQLLEPRAVLSHHTAAEVLKAPVPESRMGHVTVQRGQLRSTARGVTVHETRHLEPFEHDGRLLTPPARTFLDLAGSTSLCELVAVGDHLVRRGHMTVR